MKLQKVSSFLMAIAILTVLSFSLSEGTFVNKVMAQVISASNQSIEKFLLINADTDTVIKELVNGTTIDISNGTNYTIQAVTSPDVVGSVLFRINNKNRSDSSAPYAVYRDDGNGNFYPTNFEAGDYTLVATPFALARVIGLKGQSKTVTFSIVDQNISQALADNLTVLLGGPYDALTGKMSPNLNEKNLIPLTEPYTALGYTYTTPGLANITVANNIFNIDPTNKVIDWVVVEIRNAQNPSVIVASKPALLKSNGEVVSLDGTTPILKTFSPNNYYVAVRHRNHLGIMTKDAVDINNSVDLTTAPLYGVSPAKIVNGKNVLWPGDTNGNGQIKYSGSNNDRDLILTVVGSTTPENTVSIYNRADTNMDGIVKYTGDKNDRDVISTSLQTSAGARVAQLP
ncbi:MAG: hypothetical protein IT284_01010 [Bacteroidetes bacterium]|nr:hypothetical protein [Bacteroidota bacterium]